MSHLLLQNTLLEVECLREDLANLRIKASDLAERSDPEGRQAMYTTLRVIEDKLHNLEKLANDKQDELQVSGIIFTVYCSF